MPPGGCTRIVRPRDLRLRWLAAVAVLTLAACGGGGGGGGEPVADTTPDIFSFTDQTGVATSTLVTSNSITVSGINAAAAISVTGGEYSIGGGGFVTAAGTVANGQTVRVRHTSAATAGTATNTTLTIGGVSDTFTSTTASMTAVTISGTIRYQRVPHNTTTSGLNYNGTFASPARAVTVHAVNSGTNAVITQAVTDDAGGYSLSVPQNTNVVIRIRAELLRTGPAPSWDVRVADNTAGDATYALVSTPASSGASNSTRDFLALSGWTGSAYTNPRSAAPFAIVDSVYEAMKKVLAADPSAVFPALLIGWSFNNRPAEGGTGPCPANGNIGTSHYVSGVLCLLGDAGNDTDEYDDHVVIHEWGHYFEDKFSRSDSIGGPHGGDDSLDMRVAFGEGWGNALSGIVTDDPFYRDSNGTQQASGFAINVETNTASPAGWFSEESVQSILYDLYDSAPDGADNLALGATPIFQAMRGGERTTTSLTSIFSFISVLKAAQPAQAAGINAIVNAQSINGSGLDAYGSSETNNGGNALDVLPVFSTLTVNGGAVNVCSIKSFGEYNKLSVHRFLRFNVGTPGLHTMTASGTDGDPDFAYFELGILRGFCEASSTTEQCQANFVAGEHVLDVYDYENAEDDPLTGGRRCFNVTVAR